MEKGYETMINKCGATHIMKTEAGQANYRKVCAERYGEDNPSKCEIFAQKKIETCLKNHGVEHPSQSPIILEKAYATNFRI